MNDICQQLNCRISYDATDTEDPKKYSENLLPSSGHYATYNIENPQVPLAFLDIGKANNSLHYMQDETCEIKSTGCPLKSFMRRENKMTRNLKRDISNAKLGHPLLITSNNCDSLAHRLSC